MVGDEKTTPQLRFPGFHTEWEEKNLGQFMTFKNGINADKGKYGHGRKFINVLDIIADTPIYNDKIIGSVSVPEKEFEKNEVIFGDILFQRSSETREDAGQSNIYLDREKSATFGGFVIRGRPTTEFDPVYFDFLLKTASARKEVTTKSGGSTRFNVGQESLSSVKVVLTLSSDEQQKIATFLSAIDDKINKLRHKRELLETYKRGLMQKLFSQEFRFNQEDGSEFPDWVEKELSEVLTPNLREVDKPKSNYLAIGIRSHMKGTFQRPDSDPAKVAMEKLYVVSEGDLVVNITFAWEGAIAIVPPEDEGGLVSHRFPTYEFKNGMLIKDYFRHVISQQKFRFKLDMISPGGAGRNRVMSKRDFLKIVWNFPSVEEQQRVADCLVAFDVKIKAIIQQITKLETFKKGLLQKMFV